MAKRDWIDKIVRDINKTTKRRDRHDTLMLLGYRLRDLYGCELWDELETEIRLRVKQWNGMGTPDDLALAEEAPRKLVLSRSGKRPNATAEYDKERHQLTLAVEGSEIVRYKVWPDCDKDSAYFGDADRRPETKEKIVEKWMTAFITSTMKC